MKEFLEGLLPRLLPGVPFKCIPHEGKSDLEKSLPRKLRGWRAPGARFIIVRDQDSGDCVAIKQRLQALCAEAGKPEARVCIACRELEAWFIGDLRAVGREFSDSRLAQLQKKSKYREPDRLESPSRELMALVPTYGKVQGARRLGRRLDPQKSGSSSFRYFAKAVAEEARQLPI